MDNNNLYLSIDLKKGRIRIHKNTLHALGDPDYIQILINPETQVIAIRKCTTKDKLYHHIKWKVLASNQCYEIHSKMLMNMIDQMCLNYTPGHTYRILGKPYPKDKLVAFQISDSVDIES